MDVIDISLVDQTARDRAGLADNSCSFPVIAQVDYSKTESVQMWRTFSG